MTGRGRRRLHIPYILTEKSEAGEHDALAEGAYPLGYSPLPEQGNGCMK